MLRATLLGCCVLTGAAPMASDGDDFGIMSDKVPELKPLAHYVGAWDVAFDNRELPFSKGKVAAKWVLDGRFVDQEWEVIDKNGGVALRVKTLYAFDAGKNAYRSWTFVSDGNVTESDGVWDDKARTMTFIAKKKEGEAFSTTTSDFSEKGVETWKIAIADPTGKPAIDIVGKSTRRKIPSDEKRK